MHIICRHRLIFASCRLWYVIEILSLYCVQYPPNLIEKALRWRCDVCCVYPDSDICSISVALAFTRVLNTQSRTAKSCNWDCQFDYMYTQWLSKCRHAYSYLYTLEIVNHMMLYYIYWDLLNRIGLSVLSSSLLQLARPTTVKSTKQLTESAMSSFFPCWYWFVSSSMWERGFTTTV